MPCNCLCTAAISDVRRLAPWRPVCCEVPSVLLQSSQGAVNYDCNLTSSMPLSKTREQVAKLTLPDPSEPAGTALPAKANRKTPRNSAPSARPNLTHPCSSKSSTVSVDARTAHFFVTARGYEALLLHVILWHAGTSPRSASGLCKRPGIVYRNKRDQQAVQVCLSSPVPLPAACKLLSTLMSDQAEHAASTWLTDLRG